MVVSLGLAAAPAAAQSGSLSLPPGVSLPPGMTLPSGALPPGFSTTGAQPGEVVSFLGQLPASEKDALLSGRWLPASPSAADVKALLSAPSGVVPPGLQGALQAFGTATAGSVTAAAVSRLLASPSGSPAPFQDLGTAPWAQQAVDALSAAGVVNGVGAGEFDPQGHLTQEQFVTMLMRVLHPGAAAPAQPVPGVDRWAQAAVGQALASGLFGSGISLDPTSPVDRYQMITLVVRALGLGSTVQQLAALPTGLKTHGAVPAWARGPAALAALLGLLKGEGNGYLGGQQLLTRAEITVLLGRLLNLLHESLKATQAAAIFTVAPSPLDPGQAATIEGQGFGSTAGSVRWTPAAAVAATPTGSGASGTAPDAATSGGPQAASWTVLSWSAASIRVQVPAGTAPGGGTLTLKTADGHRASAFAQVQRSSPLSFAKPGPDGMVKVTGRAGQVFYVKATDATILGGWSSARQMRFLSGIGPVLQRWSQHPASGLTGGAHLGGPPGRYATAFHGSPLSVRVLPLAATASTTACGSAKTVTQVYGPGHQPFAAFSQNESYNIPSTTLAGVTVYSGDAYGWAQGDPVSGAGAEIAWATGIAAGRTDGTFTADYQGQACQGHTDAVTVQAKVLTVQATDSASLEGADCFPLSVYQVLKPSQANPVDTTDRVSSCLSTLSAAVASMPEDEVASATAQGLADLSDAVDGALTAFSSFEDASAIPGILGTTQVSTFSWQGQLSAGESLAVHLDTSAVAGNSGLGVGLSRVQWVALVRVREYVSGRAPAATGTAFVLKSPNGVEGAWQPVADAPAAPPVFACPEQGVTGVGFQTLPGLPSKDDGLLVSNAVLDLSRLTRDPWLGGTSTGEAQTERAPSLDLSALPQGEFSVPAGPGWWEAQMKLYSNAGRLLGSSPVTVLRVLAACPPHGWTTSGEGMWNQAQVPQLTATAPPGAITDYNTGTVDATAGSTVSIEATMPGYANGETMLLLAAGAGCSKGPLGCVPTNLLLAHTVVQGGRVHFQWTATTPGVWTLWVVGCGSVGLAPGSTMNLAWLTLDVAAGSGG